MCESYNLLYFALFVSGWKLPEIMSIKEKQQKAILFLTAKAVSFHVDSFSIFAEEISAELDRIVPLPMVQEVLL